MAREDQIHARIDLLENVDQRPGDPAAAFVVEADIGVQALMDRDHDRIRALFFQQRHGAVDRRRLVAEGQPVDPAGRHQRGGFLQRQADHADLYLARGGLERLDSIGGEQRAAILHRDVRGEEGEVRAGKIGLDRARIAQGQLLAAAILHALEFAPALVEFVVADRVEIQPDAVHRADRRLVEEQRGDQRARPDQVAGCDHHRVFVLRAHRIDRSGQPGRAAGLRLAPVAQLHGPGDRLQIAVEIVEPDDADGHGLG